MSSRTTFFACCLVGLGVLWACDDPGPTEPGVVATDGGSSSSEDASTDTRDGASSIDAAPPPACEGACKTTDAKAAFMTTQPFDRAQFGLEGEAGAPRYYVEAYAGGDPACPTKDSVSPERTFIVSNLPRGSAGQAFTKADGVTGALLDFKGNLLSSPKPESATSITVTLGPADAAADAQWVAFDVDATFPSGTIKGHFYATRCTTLD